jgi:hypothetical protein
MRAQKEKYSKPAIQKYLAAYRYLKNLSVNAAGSLPVVTHKLFSSVIEEVDQHCCGKQDCQPQKKQGQYEAAKQRHRHARYD